jgi:hypothetical protein
MTTTRMTLLCFAIASLSWACADDAAQDALPNENDEPGADSATPEPETPDAATADAALADAAVVPDDGCREDELEADMPRTPLAGDDVVDGAVPAGSYAISSTYLRLPEGEAARERFFALVGPVLADLTTREGAVASALALSASCNTARTLTVWRDQDAMYEFVAGEAHLAAMAAVGEVSRGGSIAKHWLGDESEANWDSAAEQLGAFDGRTY